MALANMGFKDQKLVSFGGGGNRREREGRAKGEKKRKRKKMEKLSKPRYGTNLGYEF